MLNSSRLSPHHNSEALPCEAVARIGSARSSSSCVAVVTDDAAGACNRLPATSTPASPTASPNRTGPGVPPDAEAASQVRSSTRPCPAHRSCHQTKNEMMPATAPDQSQPRGSLSTEVVR